jgi:hypothetical protein
MIKMNFDKYFNILYSEADKPKDTEDNVIEDTDSKKSTDNQLNIPDDMDNDSKEIDNMMNSLDDLNVKDTKEKDPDYNIVNTAQDKNIGSDMDFMSDMFNDIFRSTPNEEDIEESDDVDNSNSDLDSLFNASNNDNSENNDIGDDEFDMDAMGGIDDDNSDTTSDDDKTDDKPELQGTDESEVVDNASEIKRKNVLKKKLLSLYNIYRQDIDAWSDLKLPPDKEQIYKPFFDEYKDILDKLNNYILNFTNKDTSFVMLKTLLMFKYLLSVLDAQTKEITDIIFPSKSRKRK